VRGEVGFPVRIRFSELGKVRFISHRDAARAFDRAFRIEALPIALTEGFSPRPQVSFGLALSVGHESVAEYMDVRFAEVIDLDDLPGRIGMPVGMHDHGKAGRRQLSGDGRADGPAPSCHQCAFLCHACTYFKKIEARPVTTVRPSDEMAKWYMKLSPPSNRREASIVRAPACSSSRSTEHTTSLRPPT